MENARDSIKRLRNGSQSRFVAKTGIGLTHIGVNKVRELRGESHVDDTLEITRE